MYKDFYRMKTEAFINQPLPEVFFNSKPHKEAWHYLVHGINSKEPFLLLSGEYGMGKTTLCLRLTQALKEGGKLPFVFVSTPTYNYSALLRRIASCFPIPVEQDDESTVQSLIFNYFEDHQDNKGLNIIVDDVQEMDISTLNKLRLLANFNIDGFFPIRLLLFSHFSFIDKLKIDLLQPLNQRIKRRFYLEPLSFPETKEYIYFRLVRAGAPGIPSFTEDAIQKIYSYSGGVPRGINNICDGCLLLGAGRGLTVIDGGVAAKAIDFIEGTHVRPRAAAVLPSAEPERKVTLPPPADQQPVKEPAAPHITLEYPAGDVGEKPPEKTQAGGKTFNLKMYIIIALIMFVIGVVLAIYFDLKSIITSLMDFSRA